MCSYPIKIGFCGSSLYHTFIFTLEVAKGQDTCHCPPRLHTKLRRRGGGGGGKWQWQIPPFPPPSFPQWCYKFAHHLRCLGRIKEVGVRKVVIVRRSSRNAVVLSVILAYSGVLLCGILQGLAMNNCEYTILICVVLPSAAIAKGEKANLTMTQCLVVYLGCH
jgi:hypothetical protein